MWWIVFTIFIQYQGRPPFIEFADAVKSMLMNYEIYSTINVNLKMYIYDLLRMYTFAIHLLGLYMPSVGRTCLLC